MHRTLLRNVLLGGLCTALVAVPVVPAQAQVGQRAVSRIAIPVNGTSSDGGTFTGAFEIRQFAARGTQVVALGTLTGMLTSAAGEATGVARTLAVPVAVGQGAAAQSIGIQATCDILHLELGPLSLDLLGLVVNLNRVILDIDAESGPGNLLGNLLCAVVGLLDNPGALSQILNRILDILT